MPLMSQKSINRTVLLLGAYAIAMALLEAAVVVYMRRLYYPANPMELFPLHFLDVYDPILELSREVATIVMILSVAMLAERRSPTRCFAAFVYVFGVWDLFYYVWLKVLIDWPRQWLEWDVLFLIPAVWLGPWICPVAIAILLITWGSWTLLSQRETTFTTSSSAMFVCGAGLGLITFMQPAIAHGSDALSSYVPGPFGWWLFLTSYLLMAAGLAFTVWPGSQVKR
jgi:hypothetical protein